VTPGDEKKRLSQVEAGPGLGDDETPDPDLDLAPEDEGVGYRKRGRPRLPKELKRKAKLIIALTGDEMAAMMHACAEARDEKNRPLKIQDWARAVLMEATKP
jgi:hypothetical protein